MGIWNVGNITCKSANQNQYISLYLIQMIQCCHWSWCIAVMYCFCRELVYAIIRWQFPKWVKMNLPMRRYLSWVIVIIIQGDGRLLWYQKGFLISIPQVNLNRNAKTLFWRCASICWKMSPPPSLGWGTHFVLLGISWLGNCYIDIQHGLILECAFNEHGIGLLGLLFLGTKMNVYDTDRHSRFRFWIAKLCENVSCLYEFGTFSQGWIIKRVINCLPIYNLCNALE